MSLRLQQRDYLMIHCTSPELVWVSPPASTVRISWGPPPSSVSSRSLDLQWFPKYDFYINYPKKAIPKGIVLHQSFLDCLLPQVVVRSTGIAPHPRYDRDLVHHNFLLRYRVIASSQPLGISVKVHASEWYERASSNGRCTLPRSIQTSANRA